MERAKLVQRRQKHKNNVSSATQHPLNNELARVSGSPHCDWQ